MKNLGDALILQGRKRDARSEWETVLRLDPNGTADAPKEARENLAKHP
jgi:hypothetical protein